jgi:hypothetical protein
MTNDSQGWQGDVGSPPRDPKIDEMRAQAERRFGLGEWVDGAHRDTLMTGSPVHEPRYLWGEAAGTYDAVVDHLGSMTLFMAGCENRHLGDERWLAFAIWVNGLRGMTPQEVFDDLPSWRTADQ